jgi:hypothetical protein
MDAMSLYLPGILLAYSACFLGLMSPGPNILAVMGTSMSVDRKSGMALAMGVATGSFCWAVITASGLSALIIAYGSALLVIKILGGLYLLWLAYKSFRSAFSSHDIEAKALGDVDHSLRHYFARGFIVQMTNPKAAFSWIANRLGHGDRSTPMGRCRHRGRNHVTFDWDARDLCDRIFNTADDPHICQRSAMDTGCNGHVLQHCGY